MCLAPITVYNQQGKGQYTAVETACHECWQCREQAINDWVGRNIAESKTSAWARAITLTYGRNALNDVSHERSTVLTYSDVQKYLKLLRRHRFPVRYFITGEFGSLKGRAHWHVMLYGQGPQPPHMLDKNHMQEHWPHGWSFWTNPTHAAVRYNCKYIQKDMGDEERQGHLSMSKKPPLGAAYFASLARRYVAAGLAPQTLEYQFPEVVRRKEGGGHEIVPFRLKDRSAELFLDAYVDEWRRVRPKEHLPNSDLVEEHVDSGAWKNKAPTSRAFVMPEAHPPSRWKFNNELDWLIQYEKENAGEPERQFVEQFEYELRRREQRDEWERWGVPPFLKPLYSKRT